jgi:hypothetical protein
MGNEMPVLQVKEIQGIILHGYGALNAACFLLLQVQDARLAKAWLEKLPLRNSEARSAMSTSPRSRASSTRA